MIRERLEDRLKRYALKRRPGVIYAHMLDTNISALGQKRNIEAYKGYLLIGELIHTGLAAILGEPPETCTRIHVYGPDPLHPYAARFIDHGFVTLCGTADGVIGDYIVELKTTASRNPNRARWERRARIYSCLYAKPVVLVELNRVNGDIRERVIEPPSDPSACLNETVNLWLRNRYPYRGVEG